jgi:putative intracellular protease/amidase
VSLKNRNSVNPKKPKRVAIVIANPAVNAIAGWPCGFWWSELSHPYYIFTEKGYEIEVHPQTARHGRKATRHGMAQAIALRQRSDCYDSPVECAVREHPTR